MHQKFQNNSAIPILWDECTKRDIRKRVLILNMTYLAILCNTDIFLKFSYINSVLRFWTYISLILHSSEYSHLQEHEYFSRIFPTYTEQINNLANTNQVYNVQDLGTDLRKKRAAASQYWISSNSRKNSILIFYVTDPRRRTVKKKPTESEPSIQPNL